MKLSDPASEFERLAAARFWQRRARKGRGVPVRCRDKRHGPLDLGVSPEGRALFVCRTCGYYAWIADQIVRAWRKALVQAVRETEVPESAKSSGSDPDDSSDGD